MPPLYRLVRLPIHPADLIAGHQYLIAGPAGPSIGPAEFVGRSDGWYHFARPGTTFDDLVDVGEDEVGEVVWEIVVRTADEITAGRMAG